MKEEKQDDLDIEIVMGDDSELHFSEIKDSITTLRPKDSTKKKNIIIPKSKTEKEDSKK